MLLSSGQLLCWISLRSTQPAWVSLDTALFAQEVGEIGAAEIVGPAQRGGVVLVVADVGIGAIVYIAATLSIWWLRGRPDGVERDALQRARRALRSSQRLAR